MGFTPVGTIQSLSPEQYAQSVRDYYGFGYRHLAIGGLAPQWDAEIEKTIRAVMQVADKLPGRPWIHLFGIYRPKLQALSRDKIPSGMACPRFELFVPVVYELYRSGGSRSDWYSEGKPRVTLPKFKELRENMKDDVAQ